MRADTFGIAGLHDHLHAILEARIDQGDTELEVGIGERHGGMRFRVNLYSVAFCRTLYIRSVEHSFQLQRRRTAPDITEQFVNKDRFHVVRIHLVQGALFHVVTVDKHVLLVGVFPATEYSTDIGTRRHKPYAVKSIVSISYQDSFDKHLFGVFKSLFNQAFRREEECVFAKAVAERSRIAVIESRIPYKFITMLFTPAKRLHDERDGIL